jgi:hypothetical protein
MGVWLRVKLSLQAPDEQNDQSSFFLLFGSVGAFLRTTFTPRFLVTSIFTVLMLGQLKRFEIHENTKISLISYFLTM